MVRTYQNFSSQADLVRENLIIFEVIHILIKTDISPSLNQNNMRFQHFYEV